MQNYFAMDIEPLENTLTNLITPLLQSRKIELVELSVSGGHRRKLVRIYVDHPEGITVDQCAALSRDVADIFDVQDPIDGGYVLEVSSPGLTRPLKTDRDFTRVIGKRLRVVADGLGVVVGTLLSLDPDYLVVDLDGSETNIERNKVQKATVHFEL